MSKIINGVRICFLVAIVKLYFTLNFCVVTEKARPENLRQKEQSGKYRVSCCCFFYVVMVITGCRKDKTQNVTHNVSLTPKNSVDK